MGTTMRLLVLATVLLQGGCSRGSDSAQHRMDAPPTSKTAPAREETAVSPGDAGAISEEECVDAWLRERNLDPYGAPEGTMYTGGTPLFDERTGETKDRLEYVYTRQPEARKACRTAAP